MDAIEEAIMDYLWDNDIPFIGNEGETYLRVKDFSIIVRKSTLQVYKLIKKGNRLRKLKSKCVGNTILIPIKELVEFPFTSNYKGEVYMFALDEGKLKEVMK